MQYKWIMKENYYQNVSPFTATIKTNCIMLKKPNCQIQNYNLVCTLHIQNVPNCLIIVKNQPYDHMGLNSLLTKH